MPNEKFKILIPIKNLTEDGKINLTIEAQIKTKMVKMLSRSLNSMEEKIYEAYPQFNRFGQVVKGINRRVESENAIFLVIDIVLQFQGEKDAMYAEDPNIAISLDGGNKWYFVTLSEDTKQILSYRFNETTVSKILGY